MSIRILGTGLAGEFLELLAHVDGVILLGPYVIGAGAMDRSEDLVVIGRHGSGMDNVDLAAATAGGIPVVFTPYGPTESTAEHTLMLILATARRLSQFDRAVRSGNFRTQKQEQFAGRELNGKALGVVGFGRIGQRVAEMCRDALHMRIHVFDPYQDPETVSARGGILAGDLVELAGQVDVLTIHTPLTPETHHLISRDVISAMKPGAILVNAARGAVVDEAAPIEALQNGHIGGAGPDTYDPEPPDPDNPLFQLDQVVLTPHIGSFTEEGRRVMGLTVVEETLRVLHGEPPQYLANPEVWANRRTVRPWVRP